MPRNLFYKTLKLQGFKIDKALAQYREVTGATSLEREASKQAILDYHGKHNEFYRRLVKDHRTRWENLPVLTKKDLQLPLHKRLSDGFTTSNIFKGKTSGSSGHPFTFAKDKYAHAMAWAAFAHNYKDLGIDLARDYQARFYGIPLSGISRYKELLKDYVSNRKRFNVFNLNDKVLEDYVLRFRESGFNYINGYTSSIVLLAHYCRKKQIILSALCPTLTHCITTSEMLYDPDRTLIEKWIGVPVINEYGASEVGLIAIEDASKNLKVNTSTLYVEVVDNTGKPVPDGTVGSILITDLYNKAHPFIRYAIGDMGSITALENGDVILEKLQGRTSDIAHLPSGKVVPGLTFYYVTKTIISDDLNILEFTITQTKIDQFLIQYVSKTPLTEKSRVAILQAVETYLEPDLEVVFKREDTITRTASGKLKQFVSLVNTGN